MQAVSETDPTAPNGTYSTFVTVVPGAAPQVTSLSASSANEGATITLHGTGFVNHSWQPAVVFGGREAQIVGTPTATQISAKVPAGWYTRGTTASTYVWVTTCGQSSDASAFTVTGLLPSPPHISSVGNQDGLYDCRTGSPGDTLTVYGEGFSHTPSANVFDFGGVTALATSWTDVTGSTPETREGDHPRHRPHRRGDARQVHRRQRRMEHAAELHRGREDRRHAERELLLPPHRSRRREPLREPRRDGHLDPQRQRLQLAAQPRLELHARGPSPSR